MIEWFTPQGKPCAEVDDEKKTVVYANVGGCKLVLSKMGSWHLACARLGLANRPMGTRLLADAKLKAMREASHQAREMERLAKEFADTIDEELRSL